MSDIPTWHERAMAHPDHQSGMISEEMIRARMGEEITDLRAEIDRLHGAHQTACEGGDLLRAEIKRLTRERDEARTETERLRTENARLRARVAEYFSEPDTHPVEDA